MKARNAFFSSLVGIGRLTFSILDLIARRSYIEMPVAIGLLIFLIVISFESGSVWRSGHEEPASHFTVCDRYGWPIERMVGRPVTNFFRILLHGSVRQTLRYYFTGGETTTIYRIR